FAHLPRVAFAHERPGGSVAPSQRRKIGVVLAGATGPACGAERRQSRSLERVCGELREQLLVLWVRTRKAAFDVIEAQAIQGAGDSHLVSRGEGHGGTLGTVAQRRVIDHDPPRDARPMVASVLLFGHKKTSRPSLAGRSHRHQRGAKTGNLPE